MLEALAVQDGQTPGELARRLGVAPPTIVKMARRMETTGLLTRRRDTHDARLVRLHLTAHGRSVIGPVEEERRKLQELATANLTADERRHLESALVKIIGNLEAVSPAEAEPPEVDDVA